MAFSYLTPSNLYQTFKDSEKSMLPLFSPLQEYERITRNRPHPAIDKAYPKVTDGTLAAIIQETPKRYIQQLPTGIVKTNRGEWLDIFATWKLVEDIIPHANCQADALQKSWRAGSNSMTYGCAHAYVFMDEYNGELRANFKLPYITHVYLQKGKISTNESNIVFLESWYQESDIDGIIEAEKLRKKEDEKYKGEWDVKVLEEVKLIRQAKNETQKNPTERKKDDNANEDGIRIIHAFQRGVGAKFYSFIAEKSGDEDKAFIVRTKVNKDPRGVFPVHTLYYNIDLSNPLGRGVVEMSGGMQNLLDSHTQAFQYMQALEMNPPVIKRGNIPRGSIKYVPNAIWDLGTDPNANVEPVKITTNAIQNFPTTYGLLKSQILNLNASQDHSISSEAGNPTQSKTQAGVKAQESRLGVSDNYLRKQYESWFEEVCETLLNLTFAETNGMKEEILDDKTADKLRKELPDGNEFIIWDGDNEHKIYVDYDLLGQEPTYFEVDAGTSQVKEDMAQVENLQVVKELVIDMLPVSKRMQLANKFIQKLGVEDPEDITFSEEELQQATQAEQMQTQAQPQMSEEEAMLAQGLQERGIPPQLIEQAVVMHREGMAPQEILQVIMQGVQ